MSTLSWLYNSISKHLNKRLFPFWAIWACSQKIPKIAKRAKQILLVEKLQTPLKKLQKDNPKMVINKTLGKSNVCPF
jgi:hypothetical protein